MVTIQNFPVKAHKIEISIERDANGTITDSSLTFHNRIYISSLGKFVEKEATVLSASEVDPADFGALDTLLTALYESDIHKEKLGADEVV